MEGNSRKEISDSSRKRKIASIECFQIIIFFSLIKMHCFLRLFHTLKRTRHFKSFDKKYPLCWKKKKRKKKKEIYSNPPKGLSCGRRWRLYLENCAYPSYTSWAVLCDWVSRYKTVNKITIQCQQGDRYYADLQSCWHWLPHPFSHLRAELVQGKKKKVYAYT